MDAMRISGRILYLNDKGCETGREQFDLIKQQGGVTLRAFCEMDEIALTRDVTLTMDTLWRPLDGFCRITKRGKREASLWFDVGGRDVRLNAWVHGQRVEQVTLDLPQRLVYLGLHPLQGDALIVNARGIERLGEFISIECITNSISPDGDEAVGARPISIDVAYLGEKMLTVAAGTFQARHYALRWDPAWPAADLWVRRQDCVFLRLDWTHVSARYELVELVEFGQRDGECLIR